MTDPTGPTEFTIGLTWLPYLVAGLVLLGLALYARFRARTSSSATFAEFLAIRGTALMTIGIMVLLLADAASDNDGLTAVDRPIWSWMIEQRAGWLTAVARAVTQLGGTVAMSVLALAASGWLALQPVRRGDAALVASVAVGAGLLVAVTKPIIGRVRPPAEFRLVTETNASFPSGHALASIAIYGVLTAVVVRRVTDRRARAAGYGGLAVVILLIGLSRLYLGVHWSTDVAGGWLVGLGWLLLVQTTRRLWRTYPVVLRPGRRTVVDHRPPDPDRRHPGSDG